MFIDKKSKDLVTKASKGILHTLSARAIPSADNTIGVFDRSLNVIYHFRWLIMTRNPHQLWTFGIENPPNQKNKNPVGNIPRQRKGGNIVYDYQLWWLN